MENYYEYSFLINHSSGNFFMRVVSYNKKNALNMILEAEKCPPSSIEYISKVSEDLKTDCRILDIDNKEQEINKAITDKYGKISLDYKTGEYTKLN